MEKATEDALKWFLERKLRESIESRHGWLLSIENSDELEKCKGLDVDLDHIIDTNRDGVKEQRDNLKREKRLLDAWEVVGDE